MPGRAGRESGTQSGAPGHAGDESTVHIEAESIDAEADVVNVGHQPTVVLSQRAAQIVGAGLLIAVLAIVWQGWISTRQEHTIDRQASALESLKRIRGRQQVTLDSLERIQENQSTFFELVRKLIVARASNDQGQVDQIIQELGALSHQAGGPGQPGQPGQPGAQGSPGPQGASPPATPAPGSTSSTRAPPSTTTTRGVIPTLPPTTLPLPHLFPLPIAERRPALLAVTHSPVLHLTDYTYNFVVGVLMPLLVALLVRYRAPSWLKAAVNLVGTVVASAIATVVAQGGDVAVDVFVIGIFLALVTSWSSYVAAWKPLEIAPKLGAATAGIGIGKAPRGE